MWHLVNFYWCLVFHFYSQNFFLKIHSYCLWLIFSLCWWCLCCIVFTFRSLIPIFDLDFCILRRPSLPQVHKCIFSSISLKLSVLVLAIQSTKNLISCSGVRWSYSLRWVTTCLSNTGWIAYLSLLICNIKSDLHQSPLCIL